MMTMLELQQFCNGSRFYLYSWLLFLIEYYMYTHKTSRNEKICYLFLYAIFIEII